MSPSIENATAQEALAWVFRGFGERAALSTAFGPSGVVLMHLASQVKPGVKVFFIDTGFHFDETLEMIHRIQARMPVDIEVIKPEISVEQQRVVHGDGRTSWAVSARCTHARAEATGRNGLHERYVTSPN